AVGLFDDFVGEAERLEGFNRAGLDAVGLADFEASGAHFNGAGVDAGETRELGSDHRGCRTGAHDQYVHFIWNLFGAVNSVAGRFLDAWISGDISPVVNLHEWLPYRRAAQHHCLYSCDTVLTIETIVAFT